MTCEESNKTRETVRNKGSALEDASGHPVAAVGEERAQDEHLSDAHEDDDSCLAETPPLHAVVQVLRERATCTIKCGTLFN